MSRKILYLFPDTNLFIHGLALDEIGWQVLAEFDEVHLVISRPTQKEIDKHKNKGGERLARRARKASSLFREVITGGCHKIVRDTGPCVKLILRADLRPDPTLADRLDYEEPDDQLVGIVHAFRQQNLDADARVLTHDTGPMASAQMVDVPVHAVPDHWLRPPEASEEEKKIRALEAENARLRSNEPSFRIGSLDGDGNEIKALESEFVRYQALTQAQLAGLMDRIKTRFPMATDFGPREPTERAPQIGGIRFGNIKEVFTPATEEEIAAYRDETYPQWLAKCEEILRDYHKTLRRQSGPPAFCFVAVNDGARPAKDALVTIEAKGNFKVRPPAHRDREEEKEPDKASKNHKIVELPRPPDPPRGRWNTSFSGYADALGSFASLQQHIAALTSHDPVQFTRPQFDVPLLHDFDTRRDPNGFYWKPNRPRLPQSAFCLECEQWRHGVEEEYFEGEVFFGEKEDSVSGVVECRIHAENLSESVVKSIPVRIAVKRVSIFSVAENPVAALTGSAGTQRSAASK